MKNFYRKAADRKGFTLVELIVVIAILGILAGIAIPVYSGYIKKANDAADLQQLDSIKTAAVFAAVELNNDYQVDKITVTAGSDGKVTGVTVDTNATGATAPDATKFAAAVKSYLGDEYPTLKGSYKGGAVWENNAWTPVS